MEWRVALDVMPSFNADGKNVLPRVRRDAAPAVVGIFLRCVSPNEFAGKDTP